MTRFNPDINHPKFGSLVTDTVDAGQVILENIAVEIFKRQDNDYSLQYASAVWEDDSCPSLYWDEATKQERARHWRLVYRFYPEKKA